MKTLEYRTIDKSAWADGPWHYEPDKRQWQDRATGLFCLVLRHPVHGSLCGYVGVPPDHPAYGLDYNGITDAEAQANKEAFRKDTRAWAKAGYPPLDKWYAKHRLRQIDEPVPGIGEKLQNIEVHGGLTYCGESDGATREGWEKLKLTITRLAPDAVRYPRGDAAGFIRRWSKAIVYYDDYVEVLTRTMICCEMEADEPPLLWFFGFDTGHALDVSPGIDAMIEEMGPERFRVTPEMLRLMPENVYRDLAYVTAEVTSLAKQLADLYVPINIGADHA